MIDYLEALLEEQEREEAQVLGIALPAEEGRFYRRREKREKGVEGGERLWLAPEETDALAEGWAVAAGEAPGGGGAEAENTAGKELVRRAEEIQGLRARSSTAAEGGPWGDGEGPQTETDSPPVGAAPSGGEWERGEPLPVWLEEARTPEGPETGGGAGWLYQRIRAAAAAAGYTGRAGKIVTLEKESGTAGASSSMEELDRALERDARRYDGGFALF